MLDRDARHIALPQVGERGQQRIAAGKALLIGVGGIGCAAATCLAAAGVGRLTLSDFDTVDATNLARQPLYHDDDVGKRKVEVAQMRLKTVNPAVDISIQTEKLTGDALYEAIAAVDVVLDCSDNFTTRFLVNDTCVKTAKTLVSGAAIRFEGQLAVFGPDYASSPCYRCLYSETDESLESCAGNGVLAAIPAVIGNMMAVETLKILAGLPPSTGKLQLYDAQASEFRTVKTRKREGCLTCSSTQ